MSEIVAPPDGSKPVLLLDVDGVLLVVGKRPPPGFEVLKAAKDRVFYCRQHGPWIRDLLKLADTYYLTSHQKMAHHDIGRHLKLPRLDWINYGAFQDTTIGERAAAAQALFPNRGLVWVDDDFRDYEFEWADTRVANGNPTLLVKPDSERGLQYEHIVAIHNWLGRIASAPNS